MSKITSIISLDNPPNCSSSFSITHNAFECHQKPQLSDPILDLVKFSSNLYTRAIVACKWRITPHSSNQFPISHKRALKMNTRADIFDDEVLCSVSTSAVQELRHIKLQNRIFATSRLDLDSFAVDQLKQTVSAR